ncbi:MAG: AraC family transcriptional regulator [Sphingobacteriales bacterium]|nr:AraC family transcriptional regulator [Sphingobacteriales bacterium]
MYAETILPAGGIAAYVKSILVFENEQPGLNTMLPFFADGCPGIIYQDAPNGLYVHPPKKKMPSFFLYGQTIRPIELSVRGKYRLLIFQLYPTAVKSLLHVNPKDFTDSCYDLRLLPQSSIPGLIRQLRHTPELLAQVEIISSFLATLAKTKKKTLGDKVQLSIKLILDRKGTISIRELRASLHITERTFERQFMTQVGVGPKQFARIIQFQHSLNQLNANNYARLTDIVFENGFADQSHFIRAFKHYTGKTPNAFKKKKK